MIKGEKHRGFRLRREDEAEMEFLNLSSNSALVLDHNKRLQDWNAKSDYPNKPSDLDIIFDIFYELIFYRMPLEI